MGYIALLESPKLISRKIQVLENHEISTLCVQECLDLGHCSRKKAKSKETEQEKGSFEQMQKLIKKLRSAQKALKK